LGYHNQEICQYPHASKYPGIPAMVCPKCGEEYVPGDIAGDVIDTVSRTIDETEGLLKRTETHRKNLLTEHPISPPKPLELTSAP